MMNNLRVKKVIFLSFIATVIMVATVWVFVTYQKDGTLPFSNTNFSLNSKPSEKFQQKIAEIQELRETLMSKQAIIKEKQEFFKSKIVSLKEAVKEQSNNVSEDSFQKVITDRQIKNYLENIRKSKAYLKKTQEMEAKIAIDINNLTILENLLVSSNENVVINNNLQEKEVLYEK